MVAYNIDRFHSAQEWSYKTALEEIKLGRKMSHWMWFIFPQIKGLGHSATAIFYSISCLDEAIAYLDDEVLGARMREISNELLKHSDKSVESILGEIDSLKLKSSMTLFDIISPNDVFNKVLTTFFEGQRCERTLQMV